MNGLHWSEIVQQIGPTTGALILSALLLFLLRIPQSSRVVAETYDAIIKQLRADSRELRIQNSQQQDEILQLESDLVALRRQHALDIAALRSESRSALELAEERCDERLAALERLIRNTDKGDTP